MSRIVGGLLAFALGLPPVAAELRAQDRPSAPSERYKVILKESEDRYNAAHKEFVASAPKGRQPSDEQRMTFVGRAYRIKYEQAPKLVELAEKYPKDPIALDALTEAVWQVNTVPWPVELVGRGAPQGLRAPRARSSPERQARPPLRADLLRPLRGVRDVPARGPGEEPPQGGPGPGLPGAGPFPGQPPAETRPDPGGGWPGHGVSRPLR